MRYKILRIEKIIGTSHEFEQCSIIVSDLEAFRKTIKADEAHFVYDVID